MRIINKWGAASLALALAASLTLAGAAWAQSQTGGGPGGKPGQALCTGDQCQVPGTGAGAKGPGQGNCPAGQAKGQGTPCPRRQAPKAQTTPAPGQTEAGK